jgi:hypothetical protein
MLIFGQKKNKTLDQLLKEIQLIQHYHIAEPENFGCTRISQEIKCPLGCFDSVTEPPKSLYQQLNNLVTQTNNFILLMFTYSGRYIYKTCQAGF